jgi:hypothetical protein
MLKGFPVTKHSSLFTTFVTKKMKLCEYSPVWIDIFYSFYELFKNILRTFYDVFTLILKIMVSNRNTFKDFHTFILR